MSKAHFPLNKSVIFMISTSSLSTCLKDSTLFYFPVVFVLCPNDVITHCHIKFNVV